ncbi:MAG: tRNA (adenosine(37)-N6)-dimethylallyltransferase MiaA [Bacteroidales bacterium]|jgi:tRNA dimethylallyltransferase|nr:tRNA (adenosine(37)-N6)-dimethylallyltransferase MiaA [Bacteroidales bacterium]
MSVKKNKLIVIEGPTGVGKTAYAIDVAKALKTEIISADSRQFYKELNIGVARPSKEELAAVKHHFIAHIGIEDYYSVSKFETDVLALLENLFQKYENVVMVGGSGLYVNAVCQGIDELPDPDEQLRNDIEQLYETQGIEALRAQLKILDPVFYNQIDLANHKRLRRAVEVCLQTGKPYSELRTNTKKPRSFEIERIAVNRDKDELYDRINHRVDIMLQDGLLDEVQKLYSFKHLNALNTVGYKELFEHFDGIISLEQAITDIKTHSRRYAKRQLTWLRAQEGIRWEIL